MLLDHLMRFHAAIVGVDHQQFSVFYSSNSNSKLKRMQCHRFQTIRLAPASRVTDCHESRAGTTAHLFNVQKNNNKKTGHVQYSTAAFFD